MYNDTIVAPSTGMINQPIGVIRVSGEQAHTMINCLLKKSIVDFNTTINYRWVYDQDSRKIDECLIMAYTAPRSFTGEDMVEINCHGSVVVVNEIVDLLIACGCRLALRGEFSQRAFLNGKINLIQAEAINDLIAAPNRTASKLAVHNLQSSSAGQLSKIRNKLLDIIANINVNIDYPEYDGVGDLTTQEAQKQLFALNQELEKIVEISTGAKYIRQGINTIILGKPNVGKSSLLNALLNEEKAIVSDEQGTTRDVVEGRVNLFDLTLNLMDTAGIRDQAAKIEALGIAKSIEKISFADLCIVVLNGADDLLRDDDLRILNLTKNKKRIVVVNKADLQSNLILPKSIDNVCYVSALNHDLQELYILIKKQFASLDLSNSDQAILSSINQISIVKNVANLLKISYNDSVNNVPVDLIAINLESAWNNLGQLLGDVSDESVIDAMFRNYCLGK